MLFSSEDASIQTALNPFNPADYGVLDLQFKYCIILRKEIEEVLL